MAPRRVAMHGGQGGQRGRGVARHRDRDRDRGHDDRADRGPQPPPLVERRRPCRRGGMPRCRHRRGHHGDPDASLAQRGHLADAIVTGRRAREERFDIDERVAAVVLAFLDERTPAIGIRALGHELDREAELRASGRVVSDAKSCDTAIEMAEGVLLGVCPRGRRDREHEEGGSDPHARYDGTARCGPSWAPRSPWHQRQILRRWTRDAVDRSRSNERGVRHR